MYEIHDVLLSLQVSDYPVFKSLKRLLVKCSKSTAKKAWPALLILQIHGKGCIRSCIAFLGGIAPKHIQVLRGFGFFHCDIIFSLHIVVVVARAEAAASMESHGKPQVPEWRQGSWGVLAAGWKGGKPHPSRARYRVVHGDELWPDEGAEAA